MAIVKGSPFRGISGKVGNHVYKTRNGEIVMASAPMSSGTVRRKYSHQASKLNNLVAVYKLFEQKLKSGFEYKKSNQTDYNCFVSVNMSHTRVYTSREENKTSLCVLAPYQITQGSLPSVGYSKGVSDIRLNTDTLPTTVGELAKAVVDNNPDFAYGDQITIYVAFQTKDSLGVDTARLKSFKVELIVASEEKLTDVFSSELKMTKKCLAITLPSAINAYAFVHSRVVGGVVHFSTQILELSSEELLSQYTDPVKAGVGLIVEYMRPNTINEPANTYGEDDGGGSGSGGSGGSGDGIDTGD